MTSTDSPTPDLVDGDGNLGDQLEFPGRPDLTGKLANTSQWRAHALHMANWGGFEGVTRIDLSADTTLVTGASGAGKSSMLDAYTALMMDYGVKFNGASNDAVTGRARGEDQRSVLSYLRGMKDTVTRDGERVAAVLRGEKNATWGAVAMTFRNDHGDYFTALRAFYAPVTATRDSEVQRRFATFHGPFTDLSVLEDAGRSGLPKQALRDALPGVALHTNYRQLAAALSTSLGIGANGDAEKALALLARVQSGHKVATVDGLYKELVIERPDTYDAADAAISHFNDMDDAYRSMVDDLAKISLLDPVTGLHQQLADRRAELADLRHLGVDDGPDSPFTEWRLRTEERLLEAAEDANRAQRQQVTASLTEGRAALAQVTAQHQAAVLDHQAAGGGELDAIAAEIERLTRQRTETSGRRDRFDDATAVLGAALADRADFDTLTAQAREAVDTEDTTRADLKQRRETVMATLHEPLAERAELRRELDSLATRTGSVPEWMDTARRQMAQVTGIAVEELPFVAELLDVAPDQGRWRTAVEETLGSFARRMLVPEEHLERFSAGIDQLRLRGRIRFEGVTGEPHQPRSGVLGRISGTLVFAESPYSWWVAQKVTNPREDPECVEDPSALAGGSYRVTPTGQTRRGRGGAHGRSSERHIIGFTSEHAVAAIERRLAELGTAIGGGDDRLRALEAEEQELTRTLSAYRQVLATVWADIDVDALTGRIATQVATRDRILASDTTLADLAQAVEQLAGKVKHTERLVWGLEEQLATLEKTRDELVARKDKVTDALDGLDRRGTSGLTDAAAAFIDRLVAEEGDTPPGTVEELAQLARLLRARVQDKSAAARTATETLTRDIERVFTSYLAQWPDPNLTDTLASYGEFLDILTDLRAKGLYSWHDTWARTTSKWAATYLVPLHAAYGAALETIHGRLDPINGILATLPFGADRDRLSIRMRTLSPPSVAAFNKRLRTLAGLATADLSSLSEEQVQATFESLRDFIAQLRERRDERRGKVEYRRDELLDVRHHIEITAVAYDPATGEEKATYDALGGKSGGESQELVAFIVGAALRYQLGDELRSRPRFAVVLLDEGFVKSDGEFTGRSMSAWRQLGFQLIVAAPLDKATSLEPYCDGFLAVTKLTGGYSRALPIPAGAGRTVSLVNAVVAEEADRTEVAS